MPSFGAGPVLDPEAQFLKERKERVLEVIKKHQRSLTPDFMLDLAEFLQYDDADITYQARRAIRQTPKWRDLTIEMAESKQPRSRMLALELLVMDTKDPAFCTAYATLLKDRVAIIRRRAVTKAPLWRENEEFPAVRAALGEIAQKEGNAVLRSSNLLYVGRVADESMLPILVKAMKEKDLEVRKGAIRGWGELAVASTESSLRVQGQEKLLEVLEKGEMPDKLAAIPYLARVGDGNGSDMLRKIASDSETDEKIRLAIEKALLDRKL